MEVFNAAEWYEVPGQGWVAVIVGVDDYDLTELVGHQVAIGGATHLVLGIEQPRLPDPTGRTFGLLVGAS
jgi:hypothetical protein